jgi:glycosyltransferase involved in cell wall biosynthesis
MKALALVEAPEHVCCRYRIRAFEPALARAGWSLDLRPIERSFLGRAHQLAALVPADTVILQRKLLPRWQLRLLRRRARRLVFDFDDAVLYRDSYDPRGPDCPRRTRRFAATVQMCDLVIAGNDFLADCALRAGAPAEAVRVIPTCIPVERYRPRAHEGPARTGLELVWIGSSSTLKGLEQERLLWDHVAESVPGVRLRLISDRRADLGAMPVVAVAWSQASEARELAAADAGVTFVPDDLWSRGKCGLKVLQYMAAGLPVLANPVGVHTEMIRPGISGFLPATPSAWAAAARTLAEDPALRQRMGLAARRTVETEYAVGAWEGAFLGAVSGSSPVPAPAFAARQFPTATTGDGAGPVPEVATAWRGGASG